MRANTSELLDILKAGLKSPNVVVMPDFFMDRLVNLECNTQEFLRQIEEIVERKGGSIDQVSQTNQRGGNAINVASALLALGAKVIPIVCTNQMGLEQIRFHLREFDVDFSRIKTFPYASVTTALEFKTDTSKANVMLRDLGSLKNFGPEDMLEEDYQIIDNANYVCVFNWAGTLKYGTRLAEAVFKRAKAKGKCETYLATADLIPNEDGIPKLMEKVIRTDQVDILSLNENEAVTLASQLSDEVTKQRRKIEFGELALLSAQILAEKLKARIDLHTTTFSVTIRQGEAVLVPAFKVKPLRATGAGDAWDAGNIVADASGLSDECRLTLANAVSACYLSDPEGTHPSRQKLTSFLRKADNTM